MTAPQSTPLPPAPQRNEPESVFIPKANAFVAAQEPFRIELQEQADFVNVESQAAQSSAASAKASEEMALSAGNYAGVWSDLTGSLAAGMSVAHLGQYWGSLVAIADITLSEPSISADWQAIGGELGTAAVRNTGTAQDQIPLNSDLSASAKSGDYNDLSNLPTLGTAAAKNTGLNTGDVLTPEGAGLDNGETNWTSGNTNFSDFGVDAVSSIIAVGVATGATGSLFPLSVTFNPASITVTGTFLVVTSSFQVRASGVTPVLDAASSDRLAFVGVPISGGAANEVLFLRAEDASSKIKVNN